MLLQMEGPFVRVAGVPVSHFPKIDKVFSILVYSPRRCVIS